MTVKNTSQLVDSHIAKDDTSIFVNRMKGIVQSKIDSLIKGMGETYQVIFGDEVPNTEYLKELKQRIALVNNSLDTINPSYRDEFGVKLSVQVLLKDLKQLAAAEWPLAFQYAIEKVRKIQDRCAFAKVTFQGLLDSKDTLAFEKYESRANEALESAKKTLANQSGPKERNILMEHTLEQIRKVKEDLELHLAILSISALKEKIIKKIKKAKDKFEELDLTEEEKEAEKIEKSTERYIQSDINNKMQAFTFQLNWLQELNATVEKKYLVRMVQQKCEEIYDKHLELDSESIYFTYIEQRIEKYLKFCMLKKTFEGYSDEQKSYFINKAKELTEQAKESLVGYFNTTTRPDQPKLNIYDISATKTGKEVERLIIGYIGRLYMICGTTWGKVPLVIKNRVRLK